MRLALSNCKMSEHVMQRPVHGSVSSEVQLTQLFTLHSISLNKGRDYIQVYRTAIQRPHTQANNVKQPRRFLTLPYLTSLQSTDLKPETKQFKNQMSLNVNYCFIIINIFMTLFWFFLGILQIIRPHTPQLSSIPVSFFQIPSFNSSVNIS
jgi:hypothetical protein